MLNFILYTIFIAFTASATSLLSNDPLLIVLMCALIALFIYKNKRVDYGIIFIVLFWVFINIISYFINGSESFSLKSFSGVTMRLLMPYLIMKIIGKGFFDGLQKYLFALCVISFPFFLVESFFPSFIQSLAPYLNFMTYDEQVEHGGFYIFIYMHSGWAPIMYDFTIRNSGFMWEPGAYSAILSFMIVYQLFKNNFKITLKILFLVLCMISTYSTSGFMALFSIIIMYFFYNKKFYSRYKAIIPVLIIPIMIGGYVLYQKAEFLEEKIERYVEQGTDSYEWRYKENKKTRVTRLGFMIIALESSLHNPFGNGTTHNKYIATRYHNATGPNSIADVLIQWGWIGVLVLAYCLFNFRINGRKCGLILLLPFSLCLFSNPFSFRYLIFAIVFAVLCRLEEEEEEEVAEDIQLTEEMKLLS